VDRLLGLLPAGAAVVQAVQKQVQHAVKFPLELVIGQL
jgi:hypothetical protein